MKKKFKNIYLILSLLLIGMTSASAQEITRIDYIPWIIPGNANSSLTLTDNLIEDNGRYYMRFSSVEPEADLRDWGVDVDMSNMPDPIPIDSSSSVSRSSLLLEYVPGEGFVDYTLFNYGSVFEKADIAVDGDHIALAINTKKLGLDNVLVYPDTSQIVRDSISGRDLIVYDKLNDTILWHLQHDIDWAIEDDCIELHGDHIYYSTVFATHMPFMDDSLTHWYPDSFFVQYTTMIHKINWRTNERIWSHHMGSYDLTDRVREIKVVDDGSVMVQMELNGPFTWDGVQLDPDHFRSSGGHLAATGYNLGLVKMSQDGDYISHAHVKSIHSNTFRDVKIEDSGEVLCSGRVVNGAFVEYKQDTIFFENDVLSSGIFMVFDKDLNLQWYKKYMGDVNESGFGGRIVKGANKLLNGDIIHYLKFAINTNIDTAFIEALHPEVYYSDTYIVHNDWSGTSVSEPVYFTGETRLYDIKEVAENHFLFVVEMVRSDMADILPFLGEDMYYDGFFKYNLIIEVKGDLFESTTAINNLMRNVDLSLYPNPCIQGQPLSLDIDDNLVGKSASIKVTNGNGGVIRNFEVSNLATSQTINTSGIIPGIYICTIQSNDRLISKPFIIE